MSAIYSARKISLSTLQDNYTSDDLAEVINLLLPLRNKWFDVGIQIGADPHRLQEIRSNMTLADNQARLTEMLIDRLNREPLPVELLQKALKTPAIDASGIMLNAESNSSSLVEVEEKVSRKLCCDMQKLPTYANGEPTDYSFKVIAVGDPGVGKTSLLQRFAKASSDVTEPTIAFGEYFRVVEVDSGAKIKLNLWDTAGYEKNFAPLTESYFRDTDAVLIVFDITSKESYEHAVMKKEKKRGNDTMFKTWIKEVRYHCADDNDPPIIFLVGNKNDMKTRQVLREEASEFAISSNMDYIETSSLEDNNVDQLFFLVCQRLLEKHQQPNRPRIQSAESVIKLTPERQNTRRRTRRFKC